MLDTCRMLRQNLEKDKASALRKFKFKKKKKRIYGVEYLLTLAETQRSIFI